MKEDKLYQLLVTKMREVSSLPPQQMGPFTTIYKRVVPHLKFYPWKSIIFISFFFTTLLYLVFGIKIIKLASLLQFGF